MQFVDPEVLMGDVERRLGAPLEALAPLCVRAARMADAMIRDLLAGEVSAGQEAARITRMIDALYAGMSGPAIAVRSAFAAALVVRLRAEAAMAGVPLPPARRKI